MEKWKIEPFTLSRDDSIMEGWPDLIRIKGGRLLVAYNECVAHGNRDHSRITARLSDDDGHTWSNKIYIGEETFHQDNWNSIRVSQLTDGRLLLVCDRVIGHETSDKTNLYMWESRDRGETWSEKRQLGIFGYCADKIRELSDGSLLLCVGLFDPTRGTTKVIAHKSYDGGVNWQETGIVAQSDHYTFIEPAALELSDGSIAVFLRENSFKDYNGFVVFSYDKGKSFEDLREIPVPGMHRPVVGHLPDGRILLSYREFLHGEKRNLKACVFEETALFSSSTFEIHAIDHDRNPEADGGYSAWAVMPDGSLLMVNYIVDDAPRAYIRGYRIQYKEKNHDT